MLCGLYHFGHLYGDTFMGGEWPRKCPWQDIGVAPYCGTVGKMEKGKGRWCSCLYTCHVSIYGEWRYSSSFLTSALGAGSPQYISNTRLGGPHSWSGHFGEEGSILPLSRFELRVKRNPGKEAYKIGKVDFFFPVDRFSWGEYLRHELWHSLRYNNFISQRGLKKTLRILKFLFPRLEFKWWTFSAHGEFVFTLMVWTMNLLVAVGRSQWGNNSSYRNMRYVAEGNEEWGRNYIVWIDPNPIRVPRRKTDV